jgi:hypothetical protein
MNLLSAYFTTSQRLYWLRTALSEAVDAARGDRSLATVRDSRSVPSSKIKIPDYLLLKVAAKPKRSRLSLVCFEAEAWNLASLLVIALSIIKWHCRGRRWSLGGCCWFTARRGWPSGFWVYAWWKNNCAQGTFCSNLEFGDKFHGHQNLADHSPTFRNQLVGQWRHR